MEGFSASGGETQGSEADAVEWTASGTNGGGSGGEGGAGPLSPPSAAGAGAVKREATPRLHGPCWGGQIAGTECQPVQAKSNAFREHFCASCRSGTIFIPASRLRIVEPGSELANVYTGGVWNEPRSPGRVKQPRPALPAHRVINQTKCSTGAKLVVLQRETAAPLLGLATLGDALGGSMIGFKVTKTLKPIAMVPYPPRWPPSQPASRRSGSPPALWTAGSKSPDSEGSCEREGDASSLPSTPSTPGMPSGWPMSDLLEASASALSVGTSVTAPAVVRLLTVDSKSKKKREAVGEAATEAAGEAGGGPGDQLDDEFVRLVFFPFASPPASPPELPHSTDPVPAVPPPSKVQPLPLTRVVPPHRTLGRVSFGSAAWALVAPFMLAIVGPTWVRNVLIFGPILLAYVVISFRREERVETDKGGAADEEAADPEPRVGRPAAPPPSSGVNATQLLVCGLAVLAFAMVDPQSFRWTTAEAATTMLQLDFVRLGTGFFAFMLCGILVPFVACTDTHVHLSLAVLAPLAATVAIGLALWNVHSTLTYTPTELAERLRVATRPMTHISMFYASAVLGAAFGSRPPEQLSQRVKLISCALMVILTLSADSILSVRGGDPRFLVGQVCFNAPMVIAFWLTAPPGSRKLKQPVAKQIVQAVLMRGPATCD